MIAWEEAVRIARGLIGTPYAKMDCINLIKRIIRTAPGGRKDYTTAGTNALWKSYGMTKKYRDLTWRQEGISGARAGMLAFKHSGSDVHHVGLVTDCDTVIHASSALGCVAETPLQQQEGWSMLAVHRDIEAAPEAWMEENAEEQDQEGCAQKVTIVDSAGSVFCPVGDFRVLLGAVD